MSVEYASLSEVKSYLEIPQDMSQYDTKLQIILDGINGDIEEYTGEEQTNSRLKRAACKWAEYDWKKTTGAQSESDSDYSVKFSDEDIPLDVKRILDRYVDEDDEGGGGITIETL
jgi:uncharacterized membrane protein YukC